MQKMAKECNVRAIKTNVRSKIHQKLDEKKHLYHVVGEKVTYLTMKNEEVEDSKLILFCHTNECKQNS
jgi:hypothetical protein